MKRIQQTVLICIVALILLAYVIFQYYHNTCDENDVVYDTTTIASMEVKNRGPRHQSFDHLEFTLANGEQYKYIYNLSDENHALIQDAIQAQKPVHIGIANEKIYHLEIDGTALITWEKFSQTEKLSVALYSACIVFGAGAIMLAVHYNYYKNKQKILSK